jgi:pimeloyl-ACP methyl ester carboxylesterase
VLDAAIEPERMEMLKEVRKGRELVLKERERERERERKEKKKTKRRSPSTSCSSSLKTKTKKSFQPQRLLSLSEIISLDDFLSGWFRGASRKSILRGNVEDFIAYGFHAKRLEDLSCEDRAGVSDFVDRIQVSYGTRFEAGRNPRLEFMAHLWEPLKVIHSPLALRLGLESMRVFTALVLKVAGFQRGRVEIQKGARGGRGSSYEFWVLPPVIEKESSAATSAVVVEEKEEEEEEEEVAPSAALLPPRRFRFRFGGGGRRLRTGRGVTAKAFAASSSSLLDKESGKDDEDEEASQLLLLCRRLFPSSSLTKAKAKAKAANNKPASLSSSSSSSSSSDSDDPSSSAPILFLHGVGLGITPYLLFVAALRKRFPRRPLLLLEARHVSVGLFPTRAASTCDVASAAFEALSINNWRSAAVVAHSYGTFVAARMLAAHPEKVQSLVLLDPVCALTIYPQLLANFVYKPPVALLSKSEKESAESRSRSGYFWPKQQEEEEEEERKQVVEEEVSTSSPFAAAASAASSAAATARALLTAVDSARFLFSRDLTVGEAFCRRFAWHRECLWPQDLRHAGKSTLFGLAGGDDLVPSFLVKRALSVFSPQASVSGNEDRRAGHGGFLLDLQWQRRLLDGAEVVIEAGAEEERKERKEAERRRSEKNKGLQEVEVEEEEEEVEKAKAEAAAAAAPATPEKAAAASSATASFAKLLEDNCLPPRPAKRRTSFSMQQVVPVALEAL